MFFYESEVLSCLQFNTSRVLTIDFLNLFAFDAGFEKNDKRRLFALYLLNLSYLSPSLSSIKKSLLAFSIVYFVNKIFGKGKEWPKSSESTQENENQNEASQAPKTKTILGLFFEDKMQSAEKIRQSFEQNFKFYAAVSNNSKERRSAQSNLDDPAINSNQNNTLKPYGICSQRNNTICSNRILSLASENLHIDANSADLRTLQNSQNNNEITSSGRAKDSNKCSTGLPPQKGGVEKQLKKISSFTILNPKAQISAAPKPDKNSFDYLLGLPPVEFELWKVKNIAMDVFQSIFLFFIENNFSILKIIFPIFPFLFLILYFLKFTKN